MRRCVGSPATIDALALSSCSYSFPFTPTPTPTPSPPVPQHDTVSCGSQPMLPLLATSPLALAFLSSALRGLVSLFHLASCRHRYLQYP